MKYHTAHLFSHQFSTAIYTSLSIQRLYFPLQKSNSMRLKPRASQFHIQWCLATDEEEPRKRQRKYRLQKRGAYASQAWRTTAAQKWWLSNEGRQGRRREEGGRKEGKRGPSRLGARGICWCWHTEASAALHLPAKAGDLTEHKQGGHAINMCHAVPRALTPLVPPHMSL